MELYLVFTDCNNTSSQHSIWNVIERASNQVRELKRAGYKNAIFIILDNADTNGHYYV